MIHDIALRRAENGSQYILYESNKLIITKVHSLIFFYLKNQR